MVASLLPLLHYTRILQCRGKPQPNWWQYMTAWLEYSSAAARGDCDPTLHLFFFLFLWPVISGLSCHYKEWSQRGTARCKQYPIWYALAAAALRSRSFYRGSNEGSAVRGHSSGYHDEAKTAPTHSNAQCHGAGASSDTDNKRHVCHKTMDYQPVR